MSCNNSFPAILPSEKPKKCLSTAVDRLYDMWGETEEERDEFYTTFRYTPLTGIDFDGAEDQSITQRDPSKIIKVDDVYYVYYTKRISDSEPVLPGNETASVPATDWDLADIWYASSSDGFHWKELGPAVKRGLHGHYTERSVLTPDVFTEDGKYYLYFQTLKGDHYTNQFNCGAAWADSPHGPWHILEEPIIYRGIQGEWDHSHIDDPYMLKFQGKYHIYYKAGVHNSSANSNRRMRMCQGVAVADSPLGPFTKSRLNPVLNSGHETFLFPYKNGIGAVVSLNGPEKNTVQFSSDGLNFQIKSHIEMPPVAAGPYCPDKSTDGMGRGVTWGLCHINNDMGGLDKSCILARFDCSLSSTSINPYFKRENNRYNKATYFQDSMRLPFAVKAALVNAEKENV
jgi:hypothetical protein